MFKEVPIRAVTLADQVEEQILGFIRAEKLTLGDDVPTELFLAEKLNVGRNVVREALSRLRMLGIIESRRHKGMVISEPDVMKCFSKVINPYLLSRQRILDLLDFRVSLESGITELIIYNITDEDITELERIVEKHVYQEDMKLKVENEIEFHSKLYQITRNQAIIDFQNMVLPLFNYVNVNFDDFKPFNEKNRGRTVKHEDMIPFLKERDVNGYRQAIYHHLKAYTDYIKESRKSNV